MKHETETCVKTFQTPSTGAQLRPCFGLVRCLSGTNFLPIRMILLLHFLEETYKSFLSFRTSHLNSPTTTMSSKTPSKTASKTQSSGSSSTSAHHRPQISFSPDFTLTEPKNLTAQYQMAMPPLFNALVFPEGCKPRIDSFEFVNDKPVVDSHSHNESRPNSYLHQSDATT